MSTSDGDRRGWRVVSGQKIAGDSRDGGLSGSLQNSPPGKLLTEMSPEELDEFFAAEAAFWLHDDTVVVG